MLKVSIDLEGKTKDKLVAAGRLPIIITEVAAIINGLHTQFNAQSPVTAALFREAITHLCTNPESPLWIPIKGQTGFSVNIPNKEEEEE